MKASRRSGVTKENQGFSGGAVPDIQIQKEVYERVFQSEGDLVLNIRSLEGFSVCYIEIMHRYEGATKLQKEKDMRSSSE